MSYIRYIYDVIYEYFSKISRNPQPSFSLTPTGDLELVRSSPIFSPEVATIVEELSPTSSTAVLVHSHTTNKNHSPLPATSPT